MEKTYYKIVRCYEKNGEYFIEIYFSDDPEGFFLPCVITGDTEEMAESGLKDFLGEHAKQI